MSALEVTLFSGPGTGKSTTASLVFGRLKQRGHNTELSHEYAKDLTWEKAFDKLSYQPYVTAKQLWRLERLKNQVDVIVTDTSTLLCAIYGKEDGGFTPAFWNWVVDDYKRRNTLNIFLRRDPNRPYNPKGRNQTEEQAKEADDKIYDLLLNNKIDFYILDVDQENHSHVDEIVGIVEDELAKINKTE